MNTSQFWGGLAEADVGEPIDQSLRFVNNQRLVSANSRPTGNWTFSFWYKPGENFAATSRDSILRFNSNYGYQMGNASYTPSGVSPGGAFMAVNSAVSGVVQQLTDGSLNDPNAWYHVVLISESDTTRCYVNGVKSSHTAATPQGSSYMTIGSNSDSSMDDPLEGYLAEVIMLDGTVVSHTTTDGKDIIDEFGKYNGSGVWVPKKTEFTAAQYGAKGFRLTFDSGQSNGIGTDSAPTGTGHSSANNFTATGFDLYSNDVKVFFPVTGTASTAALGTTLRGTTPNGDGGTSISVNSTNHMDVDFGRLATSHTLTMTNSGSGVTIYVSPDGTANSWIASNVTNSSFTSGQTITASNSSAFRYLRFACSGYSVGNVTAPVGNFDGDVDYNDTPTSNYSTLASNAGKRSGEFTDAGLGFYSGSSGHWGSALSPHILNSGKWYWEVQDNQNEIFVGVADDKYWADLYTYYNKVPGGDADNYSVGYYTYNGTKYKAGGTTAGYGPSGTDEDIYMVAWDADTGTIWIGQNGTWNSSATQSEIENGTTTNAMYTGLTTGKNWRAIVGHAYTTASDRVKVNFGQRPFKYTIPSGYKAIQTNNHSTPTIKNGKDHFCALAYTGNGTDSHAITGLNFQPDLVWIKGNSVTDNHRIIDSVRGVSTHLVPNSIDNEPTTNAQILESFDSGGFTLNGTDAGWNGNTSTYIAWCWKAGQSFTPSQTGGLTNLSGSRNTTAGFSIVSYTGSGANSTVGHGLTTAPDLIVVKSRDSDDQWHVKHAAYTSNNHSLRFNSDAAEADFSVWQNAAPTSSVFSIGTQDGVNKSGDKFIAYCWHSVEGYSKFGEYRGTGNATNGTFIPCGFKPAFVMIKGYTNAGNWNMYDSTTNPSNPADTLFRANMTNYGQEPSSQAIELLSNGFNCIGLDSNINETYRYIYMAFAEHPFGGEDIPPATGR